MRPRYAARDFRRLHGLNGLPDPLLSAHLGLYRGYVRHANRLVARLRAARPGSPEWAEMTRRMGFEINGMRLHELYFENLVPRGTPVPEALGRALDGTWGSFSSWKREFAAMGGMRGIGWVILYRDPADGKLSNHWIGLHDHGHPAGFAPLLVMDVWEHAHPGMDRTRYVEAFLSNVDWRRVASR